MVVSSCGVVITMHTPKRIIPIHVQDVCRMNRMSRTVIHSNLYGNWSITNASSRGRTTTTRRDITKDGFKKLFIHECKVLRCHSIILPKHREYNKLYSRALARAIQKYLVVNDCAAAPVIEMPVLGCAMFKLGVRLYESIVGLQSNIKYCGTGTVCQIT